MSRPKITIHNHYAKPARDEQGGEEKTKKAKAILQNYETSSEEEMRWARGGLSQGSKK